MFYPQTIGTPKFYNESSNNQTAVDYTPVAENPTGVAEPQFNCINTSAMSNYGRTSIYTAKAETVGINLRGGFGATLAITPPKNADAVGIELEGSIACNMPTDATIIPFFGKVISQPALLAACQISGQPAMFQPQGPIPITPISVVRSHSFRQSVVIRDTTLAFGLYGFGFQVYTNATAWNIAWLQVELAVRQMSNQILVKYFNAPR